MATSAMGNVSFAFFIEIKCLSLIFGDPVLHLESEWTQHDFLNAASNRLGVSSLSRIFSADGRLFSFCIIKRKYLPCLHRSRNR